ncbi:MAG: NAD(P)-dependent oxidoreductase, partial [Acidobacteria bacterium]|nr:NAD(P)-dependent oxidoreductase [Acidobacteriota bacterium]
MAETVAFLGLGLMGEPMARNLLKGGFRMRVWNRTASRAAVLTQEGASSASTPGEAVRGADFCVCMVADPPALEAVLSGDSGALAGLRPGATLVNMGTQAIAQIEGIGARCRELGLLFVDAPVTGSRSGAVEGSLTILAGAEVMALERARPLLEKLGKTILHVGKAGDGTRAKLVLNLIQSGMLAVWSEGLALGKRLGLSPALTLQVLEHSAGNAALFRYKGPFLMKRDFSTNFSLKLMHKDIQLALGEAEKLGMNLPAC